MANEQRLIDANALMDSFRSYMVERYDRNKCALEENCKTCQPGCLWRKKVMAAPTVDAEPVIHGYWVKHNFLGHDNGRAPNAKHLDHHNGNDARCAKQRWTVMGMYESPITIIESTFDPSTKSIIKQKDDAIFAEIQQSFGVNLDRGELIRALQYDLDQYNKGYADAMASIVRCKDCKHFDKLFKGEGVVNKIGTCYLRKEDGIETAQSCDDFCSYGERKDND